MTCPACGAAVPEGARFCSTCGHSLRARADERRVVTVLFADLVGFTSLSETMDPESVKNLVDRCFELLVAEIISFGGQVDKIIGDAIVALFGAPVAHEDDAERAVRAALRMQASLEEQSEGVPADIRMRIGVNTGEVLVGALRAGGDYTAMGDVVNTASRLQTAAAPGQVLVGPATHAATRDAISYRHLGPLQARGRDEPVEAWAAEGTLAPPGYRPHRLRAPLVGRDTEMGLLCHAVMAAAQRRRAQLILLVGEAGVGKSRLAEEMASLAERDHDAAVLEGRCVPYGEANVWWPLADALRDGCGVAPEDDDEVEVEKVRSTVAALLEQPSGHAEVERVSSGLLHLMGADGALADIEPSRAREEVSRSLHAFFDAYTATRPVVLGLSDLHWADDVVLEATDKLLSHLSSKPFVLVATTRSHISDRWIPQIGRHNVLVLNLEPLDRDATVTLLSALLEGEPPHDLTALLLDRSGGNPLFLEELVALLAETGGPPRAIAHLPDTLRGLVSARLDALSAAERATLEDAAVLGRSGPVFALHVMGEHRREPVDDAVAGLVSKDILVVDGAHWEFRSDVIRDVAYNTLTKADRARRHTGVAHWLMTHEKDESVVDFAARHYVCAAGLVEELGEVDGIDRPRLFSDALSVVERAARRAEVGEQYLAADELFTNALQLAPGGDDGIRRRLLLGRGRARTGMRNLPEARADVMAAMELSTDDDRARASAITVLGDLQLKEGDPEGSVATLERAIELWQALDDEAGRAEAQRILAMTHLLRGDSKAAAQSVEAALAGFRETGDGRGEAWALQHLAWIAFSEGRADDAEARINESVAKFNEIRDVGGLGWANGLLGFVKYHRGLYDEAEAIASEVEPEARARGDQWACGMVINLRASIRQWSGRAGDAAERAQEARELFQAIGDRYGEIQSVASLARSLVALGRVGEAALLLDEGLALADQAGPGLFEMVRGAAMAAAAQAGDPERVLALMSGQEDTLDPRAIGAGDRLIALGFAHLQLGDGVTAVAFLEDAANMQWVNGFSPYADGAFALALVAADRVDEALERAGRVCDTDRATYLDRLTAQVARALGHARAGRSDAAATAFDEAQEFADSTQDRTMQALVRLARARALEAAGRPSASAALEEAEERLALLDLDPTGWDTVFRLAVGLAAPAPSGATSPAAP